VSASEPSPEQFSCTDSTASPISPPDLLRRLEEAEAELAQLRRQLEHADRLATLGTLAATIAHEFNNLLTPSLSYAQMALRAIEEGRQDPSLIQKALTKCHAAGLKAGRICDAILAFARPAASATGTPAESEVGAVIDESFAALGRDPAKDGITLRREVPEGLLAAIDPLQLEHVLVNLLINARQAMAGQRRGTITLTAGPCYGSSGPAVRIDVIDSGCGIEPEHLPHIFESFYTTRDSSTPAARGTGLGLSRCRQIVERCGGEITAHSTPGRGTTFRILLPAPRTAVLAA